MKLLPVLTVVCVLLFGGAGCATLFNQENQTLTFNTTPDSADIEVNGVVLGRTPWTGPVKRASDQQVIIRKEGYEPQTLQLKGEISPWVVANVLWGLAGLLSTSVDVSSGTGYAYQPGAYHVTLVTKGATTISLRETISEGQIKRFVLMFYPDIAREAVEGRGEKLEALRQMSGHPHSATFAQSCRRTLADTTGADAFAERIIKERMMARYDGR